MKNLNLTFYKTKFPNVRNLDLILIQIFTFDFALQKQNYDIWMKNTVQTIFTLLAYVLDNIGIYNYISISLSLSAFPVDHARCSVRNISISNELKYAFYDTRDRTYTNGKKNLFMQQFTFWKQIG